MLIFTSVYDTDIYPFDSESQSPIANHP
jgi:hypothetical protein